MELHSREVVRPQRAGPPSAVRDWYSRFEVPDPEVVACPECGEPYERLGNHWRYSPDHRPRLTQKQREIITGLLLGDGSLYRSNENPYLQVEMVTPEYLEYLDREFGVLGLGVTLRQTAVESARSVRDSGLYEEANSEDYAAKFRWLSRSHPDLWEFDWYEEGQKVWPADVELTPTTLRHWYCGDGYWDNSGGHNCIRISITNEIHNTEKVSAMFERVGLPCPRYSRRPQRNGSMKCEATFAAAASRDLWRYMGTPPPGFERKWPEEFI